MISIFEVEDDKIFEVGVTKSETEEYLYKGTIHKESKNLDKYVFYGKISIKNIIPGMNRLTYLIQNDKLFEQGVFLQNIKEV